MGGAGYGTVFAVNPSTGKERVVYSFKGKDGADPEGSDLVDLNGTLYGTTGSGGRFRDGTVFAVNPSTGKEHVVYNFKGSPDGAAPMAGVIDMNGELYGTTRSGGGSFYDGTIFEVSTSGKEAVLYNFGDGTDGANPVAGLLALNGALYGTAEGGQAGSVFEVSTSGAFQVLYDFTGPPDGELPEASLSAVNNELYGTTYHGGSNSYYCEATAGCGTVFQVSTSGTESILYRFKGQKNGAFPAASLIAVNGVLYGTTEYGGTGSVSGGGGGTVFEVKP